MSALPQPHLSKMITEEEKVTSKAKDFLAYTTKAFKEGGIEGYRQEAEILLSEVLKVESLSLYLEDIEINPCNKKRLEEFARRRLGGEPLQYIINKAFFNGLTFKVEEGVFIPRPETEVLVETTLNILKDKVLSNPCILDLGTGSGNIAISLTKELSSCKMIATDISPISLKVAEKNAKEYDLVDRIKFLKGNLFEPLSDFEGGLDVIVSNPPYVTCCELNELQAEVKREPLLALSGGEDGLYFYREIISKASSFLKRSGFLVMELAGGRWQKTQNILSDIDYKNIKVIKDYSGIERVLVARKV